MLLMNNTKLTDQEAVSKAKGMIWWIAVVGFAVAGIAYLFVSGVSPVIPLVMFTMALAALFYALKKNKSKN